MDAESKIKHLEKQVRKFKDRGEPRDLDVKEVFEAVFGEFAEELKEVLAMHRDILNAFMELASDHKEALEHIAILEPIAALARVQALMKKEDGHD